VRVSEFERVLFFDAFDAFFQLDPFEHLVKPGLMTFVGEGITIANQTGNFGMIRECFGQAAAVAVSPFVLICSGTVAGAADVFVKYLRFLTGNITRWHGCLIDQPQINYLAWSGAFELAGIPFRFENCNGTVNSMYYCSRHKIPFGDGFFDIAENKSVVNTAVIHHYLGWPSVVRNVRARCRKRKGRRGIP
jgi:hypothetical protein